MLTGAPSNARDTFVSTQVLEEYFAAATKKLRVPAEIARGKVALFGQLNVMDITTRLCKDLFLP